MILLSLTFTVWSSRPARVVKRLKLSSGEIWAAKNTSTIDGTTTTGTKMNLNGARSSRVYVKEDEIEIIFTFSFCYIVLYNTTFLNHLCTL